MPNDRCVWMPGETFFFAVNLLRRGGNGVIAAQCPSVIAPYVVCAYALSEQLPLTIDFVATAQGDATALLLTTLCAIGCFLERAPVELIA